MYFINKPHLYKTFRISYYSFICKYQSADRPPKIRFCAASHSMLTFRQFLSGFRGLCNGCRRHLILTHDNQMILFETNKHILFIYLKNKCIRRNNINHVQQVELLTYHYSDTFCTVI